MDIDRNGFSEKTRMIVEYAVLGYWECLLSEELLK